MSGERPIAKQVAENSSAEPDINQKSSSKTLSQKWKFALIVAVAIIGIACTATGIGAVVGIPLLAISGVAAVSLVSNPEKPQSKSSTHTLLKEFTKQDPD